MQKVEPTNIRITCVFYIRLYKSVELLGDFSSTDLRNPSHDLWSYIGLPQGNFRYGIIYAHTIFLIL